MLSEFVFIRPASDDTSVMRGDADRRPDAVDRCRRIFRIHRKFTADRYKRNVTPDRLNFLCGVCISGHIDPEAVNSHNITDPSFPAGMEGLKRVAGGNRFHLKAACLFFLSRGKQDDFVFRNSREA